MENFRETDPSAVDVNFIRAIGQEWMLLTAGDAERCNTMTASWGFVGEMWGRHAAVAVVRPQRYTKEFIDAAERLTLSFFDAKYRKALEYCGTHSGREGDKIAAAGLTRCLTDGGTPALSEARLILECRKMYADRLRSDCFIEPALAEKWYPKADYHTLYVLEIEKAYVRGNT